MTQKQFDELPLLLLAHEAMAALGCNEETLRTLRENNPDMVTTLPGMKHHRYVKAEVAKLARLQYK